MATDLHYLDSTVLTRDLLTPAKRNGHDAIAVSSEILRVELAVVLDGFQLEGTLALAEVALLRSQIPVLLAPLHLFPLGGEMLERAAAPFSVKVNALDAIHVATAEVIATEADGTLVFWTHDAKRAAAAVARGLRVEGLHADV